VSGKREKRLQGLLIDFSIQCGSQDAPVAAKVFFLFPKTVGKGLSHE